jgi:lipocalin
MTHFNPLKYSGMWYEISSKKVNPYGIAAKCRNTKTLLQFEVSTNKIHAQTACSDFQNNMNVFLETEIVCKNNSTKCKISYPSDPFIPTFSYNIVETGYSTYAFVATNSGKEFKNLQIFSRDPHPGQDWIDNKKNALLSKHLITQYEMDKFYDTPQDLMCIPIASLPSETSVSSPASPALPSSPS